MGTNLHIRLKRKRRQHDARFALVENISRTLFHENAWLWLPREWRRLRYLWSLYPLVVFKSLDQQMRYDFCQTVSSMHYISVNLPAYNCGVSWHQN
jgi:hypothetical protein